MSLRFNVKIKKSDANQMNPLQLAYLGDVVWEMIVRYDLIVKKYNVHHMHKKCIQLVNAHSQAEILHLIKSHLLQDELDIVQRGRNAHTRHTVPHNQSPEDYAAATGFEALFGYWYLTGNDTRIDHIVKMIKEVYFNG